jgi:hypothetical protein
VSSKPPPSEARRCHEVWDALHPQNVSDPNTTIRTSIPRSVQDPVGDGSNGAQLSEVYSPDPDPYLAGGDTVVLAGAQVVTDSIDNDRKLAAELLIQLASAQPAAAR